jgi:hypothetical protein
MEKMMTFTQILQKEDDLIENILESQVCVREAVKVRNWIDLEKNIVKMQEYATEFINLDNLREQSDKSNISEEDHILMKQIQSKLMKSKIVNSALNDYIKISRGFVQGVFDNVLSKRKNVVYSKNGSVVKTLSDSVVLNKVF